MTLPSIALKFCHTFTSKIISAKNTPISHRLFSSFHFFFPALSFPVEMPPYDLPPVTHHPHTQTTLRLYHSQPPPLSPQSQPPPFSCPKTRSRLALNLAPASGFVLFVFGFPNFFSIFFLSFFAFESFSCLCQLREASLIF